MSYDLVVIGTGPGGYVAAIRAAQLGLKVAVVEKRASHGGTCLNVGCIPSKALLHASGLYAEATHSFAKLGIVAQGVGFDLAAMMAHKEATIRSNVEGIDFLFRKNKIAVHRGTGRIIAAGRVQVAGEDGSTAELEAKAILIGTGSEVATLPGIVIDEKTVVSSTGALALDKVPDRLVVIGAGVIGLELGSVWSRLGAHVTVLEYLDRIVPGFDLEIARSFQKMLEKQGFSFKLSTRVTGVAPTDGGPVAVSFAPAGGGETETLDADIVLVAVGRKPYTEGLGLDEAGIVRDDRGRIVTDKHFQTSLAGVYAIGDVIAGPMLAHKAEDEGVALAEILAGQAGHVNYDVIPGVVYTEPEIATIGRTEEGLKAAGIAYKAGKFPFMANGRAKASLATEGFVKVLADAATDRVLGAHIIGPNAGELIHEVAVLMEFSGSAEDLARTVHAHPTLSEAVKEAALAVDRRAIHV